MLMINAYQDKLFYSFAAAMMSIALIIMGSGYFLSKRSTVGKMEQSALLELRLKKEILTRLMNHSRVTLELSKRTHVIDLLNKSSESLPYATDFFYISAAHFEDDLLQMHYVDFKNERVLHIHNDKARNEIFTQVSTDDYQTHLMDLDSLLVYDPQRAKPVVRFFNTPQNKYFRITSPVWDGRNVILGVIYLDLDMQNTFKTLVHSELFDSILLDNANRIVAGNLPNVHPPEGISPLFLPKGLLEVKKSSTDTPRIVWEEGYIYVMDTLINESGAHLDIVLRSKDNLSQITHGILQIFAGILLLIFLLSLLLSWFISRLHVTLLDKLILREELLLQEGKLVEIGSMVSYLAHQWKQPLNRIAGYLACAKGDILHPTPMHPQSTLNDLMNAERELEEMADHIETFRTFYRFSKEKELFNVKKELTHIFEMLSYALHMQQIAVEIIVEQEDITLYGLKNEWKHAILSLLNNAIDAFASATTRENAHINVHVTHSEDHIIVTIHDNAGGIDKTVSTQLFSKYASSKAKQGGTGLGLYFAKMIVEERFGGRISVSSDANTTRFTLLFTAHPNDTPPL